MTPCEKLGYKVGDRFRVIKSRHPSRNGSIVTLHQDDGSNAPYFMSGDGVKWVFRIDSDSNDRIEKIEDAKDTLTTILESAADHDTRAKHHTSEHERLMQQARDMLPDGWRLVKAEDMPDGPSLTIVDGQDMSDPANWRKGDVVECVDDEPKYCHKGGLYTVNESHLRFDGKLRIKSDDDGDNGTPPLASFRFHHRPNT